MNSILLLGSVCLGFLGAFGPQLLHLLEAKNPEAHYIEPLAFGFREIFGFCKVKKLVV